MFTLLGFTTLGIVLAVSAAILWRRPGEGLGMPMIAMLCFGYLYVIQPLTLLLTGTLSAFLDDWQTGKALFVPAVMLAFLLWGWRRGTAAGLRTREHAFSNWTQLWNWGAGAATVGTVLVLALVLRSGGLVEVFSAPHGSGLQVEDITAYWYLSPYWIICGIGMMLFAGNRAVRTPVRRAVLISSILFVYAFAILTSSRGIIFAISATVVVSYFLRRMTRPTIAKLLPYWICAGVLVVLMVGYRQILHVGNTDNTEAPTFGQALMSVSSITPSQVSQLNTGLEFLFHATALDTVDQTQKYHWGLAWLYIYTVHIIPRVLWPSKPLSFDTPGITNNDIHEMTGITISAGAAPGIVADGYEQFGALSVVFFFLFGLASARLYVHAQFSGNPLPAMGYTMLCAVSLNGLTQDVHQMLIFGPYAMLPMLAFHFLARRPRMVARVSSSAVMKGGAWAMTGRSPANGQQSPPSSFGRALGRR